MGRTIFDRDTSVLFAAIGRIRMGSEKVAGGGPKILDGDVFAGRVGDVFGIVLPYGGEWRRMFWLQVKEDASIYLGPYYKKPLWMKHLEKKSSENGKVTFGYDEGELVSDASLVKNVKASFHGSGLIRVAGKRMSAEPLRGITNQREICRVLFQHPSAFPTIRVPKQHDICIGYEFDESRPLQGVLFAAPKEMARTVFIRGARRQITVWLEFDDLQAVPGLVVQIVLGDTAEMKWPQGTLVFFLAKSAEVKETDE